ncbi:transposable element Tcb1 transposase [Trichonephila clavipes]|nr:transposable element Tcb1 transposase [Trichonephila clavipes]
MLHRDATSLPSVKDWVTLVRIDGTLNSARYFSGVLRPVALHFIRALRNPTYQQNNARPHVTGIVRTFLETENVRLFTLPARSPDFLPIENVWSMVAVRPRLISAVIIARGGCFVYWFLRIYAPKFLENLITCYFQCNIFVQ